MPELPDDQRRTMRQLINALARLRDLDVTMPVQQMMVLLWVATNEGKPQRDMLTAFADMGFVESTISRNVAALSEVHRLGKPGLGLITWKPHPVDRRVNLLELTPKGRTLCAQLHRDLS